MLSHEHRSYHSSCQLNGLDALRFEALDPMDYSLIVERSSIRSFAADHPIFIIFKHSRLSIFHNYVVVYKALGLSSNSKGYTAKFPITTKKVNIQIEYLIEKYNGCTFQLLPYGLFIP